MPALRPQPSAGAPDTPTPETASARQVLSRADLARTLARMAHQLLERTEGGHDVVLLGIPTRGVHLARRLAALVHEFEGVTLPVGSLDPTMYRDDLRMRGVRPLAATQLPPGGVDEKLVVLVDDVLFSGRTVRAALDALTGLGRPRAVQLAVLVDRGHRQLPIRADYVGKNLPTSLTEDVQVRVDEVDSDDGVLLASRPDAA